jgi:hypothetical protein
MYPNEKNKVELYLLRLFPETKKKTTNNDNILLFIDEVIFIKL